MPDDAQPRQGLQNIKGWIDLPPFETLPHAALIGVMIVVPAFAHREQGQQPIIAGIVARHISLLAAHMRERIDAESRMIEQHSAPYKTDEQARPSADEEAQHSDNKSRHEFQPMQ